ncbi:hypothetical protein JCM6882_007287 [Rhodosporidiobolus microsporus]
MMSSTSSASARDSYLPLVRDDLTNEKEGDFASEAAQQPLGKWSEYRGPGQNVLRLLFAVLVVVLLFSLAVPKSAQPQVQRPAFHPIYTDSEPPAQFLQHGGRLARREEVPPKGPSRLDTSLVFA